MVFALLLLILQWAVGMLVLILCFVERRRFSAEIVSKLGSSFSLAPFIIVVAVCTLLAMVATLPVAQLFFFHILLIKKGISTYDYIIALREQDQEQEQLAVGGQQSPQMSQVSSFTGLSSTSSFNQFHRGAWCTPPRLFLEDQVSYFHYLESYCECNLPWLRLFLKNLLIRFFLLMVEAKDNDVYEEELLDYEEEEEKAPDSVAAKVSGEAVKSYYRKLPGVLIVVAIFI
ncbi:probable protein S-acyltransferase 22 [Zingiber officinale]|uniref:probable protein S-acyltransferase 22 n=1 Tax=Zingiber officinale TaxID=94328 RepID=UPI001C4BF37C|nr:probable protein S-acyltransferase 22 [Zingiber officinale]